MNKMGAEKQKMWSDAEIQKAIKRHKDGRSSRTELKADRMVRKVHHLLLMIRTFSSTKALLFEYTIYTGIYNNFKFQVWHKHIQDIKIQSWKLHIRKHLSKKIFDLLCFKLRLLHYFFDIVHHVAGWMLSFTRDIHYKHF